MSDGEHERDRPTANPLSRTDDPADGAGWSRGVKISATLVAVALVSWFFFAWLVLDRQVVDAAGESVGTAFALGVAVSLFGALRGSR
jgi:hypothetical protein